MTNNRICLLARESQIFAGASAFASSAGERQRLLVDQFVSRLPEPELPLERIVFSGLLLDIAVRWSSDLHRQYHQHHPSKCSFDPASDVPQHWQNRGDSPLTIFGRWAMVFLDAFERAHGLPAAVRVKGMIDEENGKRISLNSLSRHGGCHPARLQSQFKSTFGMSIREYQTRRCILHAARLLVESDLKVDAVARIAGFRSRKNFYHAFHRIVGAAPSAVRDWSPADLDLLERGLLPLSDLS